MAAVRLEIEDAEIAAPFQTGRAMASRNSPLQLLVAVGTGLIVGAMLWSVLSPDTAAQSTAAGGVTPVHRSQVPSPEGQSFARGDSVAISRDGSMLALATGQGGQSRLYLRRLESLEMEAIENTEGAEYPFFSADGEQLGFFADGVLKKISLRGGVSDVTALCEAPVSSGGTWAADGWIYFIYGESRLARVSENGGEPEQLGEAGDIFRVDALPDDHGILLTLNDPDSPTIRKDTAIIAVLSPDGTTVTPVMKGGYNARYLSSGHLVFMRSGGLFAMPFDLERLQVVQPAVSVQPRVWTDSVWGRARYDVSRDGTLVFVPGGDIARTVPTWVDLESGVEEPLPVPDDIYNNFDLSPDGTKLAIQRASGSQDQVYVYDSVRGAFERLTLEGANVYPVWSHDGLEVFFSSTRHGGYRLYRKPVDGSAPASRLLTDDQEVVFGTDRNWPISVTPDGQFLLMMTWAHADRGGDMWKVPLDGSGGPEAVLITSANELIPQVSPNGKWLAYLTNRAGPYRIMVRPFPDVERREWVISGADGYDPRWSADGDALFYRQGWGLLMRASVGRANDITPGVPQQLLDIDFHDSAGSSFVVSPDGRRVLVNKPIEGSHLDETPITLVTGWATEVAQLAGPGRD